MSRQYNYPIFVLLYAHDIDIGWACGLPAYTATHLDAHSTVMMICDDARYHIDRIVQLARCVFVCEALIILFIFSLNIICVRFYLFKNKWKVIVSYARA